MNFDYENILHSKLAEDFCKVFVGDWSNGWENLSRDHLNQCKFIVNHFASAGATIQPKEAYAFWNAVSKDLNGGRWENPSGDLMLELDQLIQGIKNREESRIFSERIHAMVDQLIKAEAERQKAFAL